MRVKEGAELPSLNLVGAGRLGRAVARAFAANNVFRIANVVTRSMSGAEAAVAAIGHGQAVASIQELGPADVTLIAVNDEALIGIAARLAATGRVARGTVAFQCSGALGSDSLAPLAAIGVHVASVHPMRSFTAGGEQGDSLAGALCALEGSPIAVDLLSRSFLAIGGFIARIEPSDKIIYHAGAVIASNYVVTVIGAAIDALQLAGMTVDEAAAALRPLVEGTLENVWRLGAKRALTGPIARGDFGLVRRQHGALVGRDAHLADLYADLARATARLADRDNPLMGLESSDDNQS
jgi:predicted short-subunit dehydrogenase-like oxidoreductase (DUF2520 family)